MSALRIFSYLPNPRIWKATIAARLAGIEVEVRGAAPPELAGWLWDFDAHPLTEAERAGDANLRIGTVGFTGAGLRKTEAFLEAHPFGTVPAAFSPDGKTGIFESNSILRAVARLGESRLPLYGGDAYEASRIDGFLDASLVFARDSQIYLLSLRDGSLSPEIRARARAALTTYLGGIDRALARGRFIAGEALTIADVCFACELSMMWHERGAAAEIAGKGLEAVLDDGLRAEYPRALAHFGTLRAHPAFAPDMEPFLAKYEERVPQAPR